MDKLIHENKSFKNIIYSEKETKNRVFDNCSFVDCDLSNGIFTSSKFIDCVFTTCNLSMVKFTNCQLNNIIFKESKLLGVNFSECNDFMFSVSFEDCVIDYSSFVRKKMIKTIFKNISMKSADLTEADLSKSKFINADLTDAVFYRTNLKEADLSTAINYIIDPEENNIRKAKFAMEGLIGLLSKYNIEVC